MYNIVCFIILFIIGLVVFKNIVNSLFMALIIASIYDYFYQSKNKIIHESMTNPSKKRKKKKKKKKDKTLKHFKFPKGKYKFLPKSSKKKTLESMSNFQVNGLNKDTKKLMKTQHQLMKTLQEMGPVLEQGKSIIGAFDNFFGDGSDNKNDLSYMKKRLGLK